MSTYYSIQRGSGNGILCINVSSAPLVPRFAPSLRSVLFFHFYTKVIKNTDLGNSPPPLSKGERRNTDMRFPT